MELRKSPFLKVDSQGNNLLKTIWLYNNSKKNLVQAVILHLAIIVIVFVSEYIDHVQIFFLSLCVYILIHICIILISYLFSFHCHDIWKLVLRTSCQNDEYLVISKINLGIYNTMITQALHLKQYCMIAIEKQCWELLVKKIHGLSFSVEFSIFYLHMNLISNEFICILLVEFYTW